MHRNSEKETRKTADDQAGPTTEPSQEAVRPEDELARLREENLQLRRQLEAREKSQKRPLTRYQHIQALKPYQAELIQLQQSLEDHGKKMIILFEGRGGAGKGGTIRRITQYLNQKHYRVIALGRPTGEERSQWFYQKYVREFPCAGEMVLFDHSWYTRATIEPVFGFCTPQEYENFMEGVSGFEKDLTNQNIILLKLYFSVSQQEQMRRFANRKNNVLLRWKLDEADLDAEQYRDQFTDAKYAMLKSTHTRHAPWTIIRSDNQHLAHINAMKVILNAVGYERLDPGLDITPDPEIAVSGAVELELLEAKRLMDGRFCNPCSLFDSTQR
ncbi:MAG: polyphosphate kinase 2 [Candidatus Sedimenticola endophacoides]